MKSLPSVSLYIRITDEKGLRCYERIRRRSPQVCGPRDVYCLHFYEKNKRKWLSVGTDLSAANAARGQKEQELFLSIKENPAEAKPSRATPKSLEELRTAFIHDKKTTIKKDGTPLEPATIRSFEVVTREFLDTIKRNLPSEVTKQDLKNWMMRLRQGMRIAHSFADLSKQLHDVVCSPRVFQQVFGYAHAVHELHYKPGRPILSDAGVIDTCDRGMVKTCQDLLLEGEALTASRGEPGVAQQLNRDRAANIGPLG